MDDILPIIQGISQIASDWRAAGGLASALAIVYLLVKVTKIPVVDGLLGYKKWARPVVAAVLGAAVAFLSTVTKQPWSGVLAASVVGALSGLGAVGLDQLLTGKRNAQRLEQALMQDTSESKVELEAAKAEPDGKKRRRVLAAWARKNLGKR